MGKTSAGILAYRLRENAVEVLLAHPGGPFFAKKDIGAWSIPKGEFLDGEDAFTAAVREFKEELGYDVAGNFLPLASIKQKSGKTVYAWAVLFNADLSEFVSNTFLLEWPPGSGKMKEYPEVDKAEWFTIQMAKEKINSAQIPFLENLMLGLG